MKTVTPALGKLWLYILICLFTHSTFGQNLASLQPSGVGKQPTSGKTLKEALSELEARYAVYFIYETTLIENKLVPSSHVPAIKLEESLTQLLKPLELSFEKIKNNTYVIVAANSGKTYLKQIHRNMATSMQASTSAENKPGVSSGLLMKTSFVNTYQKFNAVTLKGKVTSQEDNTGLPGVNVLLKGTTNGTTTDANGDYSLSIPEASGTLVFSYIGYTTEEVPINGRTTIDVSLVSDIQSLSEVVVVGYGTQKKTDITGSIASVSAKEISELPITNAQQALQGRAAGVDVVTTGNKPGAGVSVRIRGRRSFAAGNEPLYVVDGIPLAGGINDINPQDIQSMEILKDASATAIYGSRGANGVVIITTKRGKTGQTSVTYDGYYGISSALGRVDMMNGQEFAEYKRESRRAKLDRNGNPTYNDNDPNADFNTPNLFDPVELQSIAEGRSTDYQDLILRNGRQMSHQVGILGGSENTQFSLSGNYFSDKGIVPGQDFNRYTLRINIDQRIGKRLKVGASTLATFSIQNGEDTNPFGNALPENPLGVPYDENGQLIFLPTNDGLRTNPLSEIVPGAIVNERRRSRIFSSLYAEYQILEGLNFKVNFGPDLQYQRRGDFQGSLTSARRQGDPTASRSDVNIFNYTLENVLNYSKTFNSIHSLNVTALYGLQSSREEFSGMGVLAVPAETQQFYNLGQANIINGVGSFLEEWSILSYMGRVNYGFNDKYLITFTGRADGSSRFAPGKKWGFFPSVALGWNINKEGFMQNIGFLDNLKLRVSYGRTGNTGINPYQTQALLSRTTYAFGTGGAFGFRPGSISNPNLRWETTASINAGLDFGFLEGRINGSLDVYRQNTTDLLMERQLPVTSGFFNVLENVGATRNTGIEVTISTVNLDLPSGFRWSTDLNVFANKEEIVELYGGKEDDIGNAWFIGKPLTVFYDYEKIGIWQLEEADLAKQYQARPGDIKVKDRNEDGKINAEDRVILGSDIPEWSGGITNRFEFKGFDFSVFVNFRQGSMIRSSFHDGNNSLFGRYNNLDVDYWTPNNPTNAYPRPDNNVEVIPFRSTLSYFDGSFVKVRNISLGYNFPTGIANALKMQSLRIYASAQQPFIFASYRQRYKGIDPEIARNPDSRNRERTAEVSADTPANRLILVGINAKF